MADNRDLVLSFRTFNEADRTEKLLVKLILEELFPGRHPTSTKNTRFAKYALRTGSRQKLNMIFMEKKIEDYGRLYIFETKHNAPPKLIGDNHMDSVSIIIHRSWISKGSFVMSTIFDGDWAGYFYRNEYSLQLPIYETQG